MGLGVAVGVGVGVGVAADRYNSRCISVTFQYC